jgi:hypothetical protein
VIADPEAGSLADPLEETLGYTPPEKIWITRLLSDFE